MPEALGDIRLMSQSITEIIACANKFNGRGRGGGTPANTGEGRLQTKLAAVRKPGAERLGR